MDKVKYNRTKGIIESTVDIIVYKEDGEYFAVIPSLDLAGYGDTKEYALHELRLSYETFCDSMINDAEFDLDDYLSSIGFKKDRFRKKRFLRESEGEQAFLNQFDNPELIQHQREVAL